MSARPGRTQAAFTAGELDPLLHDRTQLKYFSTGLKHAENVVITPQGGMRLSDGLRHVGDLAPDADRIFPFDASNGASFDMVFGGTNCQAWDATGLSASFTVAGIASLLPEMTYAQRFDTMLLFHRDLESKRIRLTTGGWVVDNLPYANLPRYDYGATYTNGVPAIWRLEFVGLDTGSSIFQLKVSQQETFSITYNSTMSTLVSSITAALTDLPNVEPGFSVASPSGNVITITFSGTGNEGDGWAVSGEVVNKADAAIVASKTQVGVPPGEAVISATRGWPQCGAFWQQRLLVGGMKGLPNAWLMSKTGDYFEFNERFTEANGPALVPMDSAGGETIEAIVPSLNLLIFTSQAEYWIAERALSRTEAPNHVQASRHGSNRGLPVTENEGAAIWCHKNRSTIGELRYTDVEGNFVATDISLLAPHLLRNVRDMAVRRTTENISCNLQAIILESGEARLVSLLREQEVTAYARRTSHGHFKRVSRNGRNELSFIMDRDGTRTLERMETGLLLDEAIDITIPSPSKEVTGLSRFNGREIWLIGDGDVFGPYTVSGGTVTLPKSVSAVTAGTWKPPIVETLPPPRDIGPNTVLKRKARIHTVHLALDDTTSLAISTNGGALKEVDLFRYGVLADVPELSQGYTGVIKISGLRGYSDEPFVRISQLRPGRLNIRSITVETAL
ncbi:phage tail protein [Rhizobium sp. CAU 1783]